MNLILERAGYTVASARDLRETTNILAGTAVDAVVVGDSISAADRQELCRALKHLNPLVPIVMICRTNDSQDERQAADEQVEAGTGPEHLLEALARVLTSKSAASAE